MLVLGDLLHLPDLPPDAAEFHAQIQAAKDEAEAGDVPRGTLDDAAAPLMVGGLAVGTKVRDKLSGQTGTVVEAPGGAGMDYGDVVFIKSDSDGATHPMLKSFLEPVPTAAPVAPMVPGPGAAALDVLPAPGPTGAAPAQEGAPAPNSPIPDKTPKTTNAALHRHRLNAMAGRPLPTRGPAPVKISVTAAAAQDDPVITGPTDARRLRYSEMLAKLKAKPQPTHNDALGLVGYVPANWDLLVARLLGDGVVLRSKKADFDVAAMVKSKLMDSEIRYILGCKGVPMYALDRALTELRGAKAPATPRAYTANDVRAFRQLYNLDARFNDAEVLAEMHQFEEKDLPVGFATINADAPTVPMPAEDPGAGMAWAWDKLGKKWYQTPKAG